MRRKGPDISISSITEASTAMAIMKEMTMTMHCIVMTAELVDLAEDSVVIVAAAAVVVVVVVEDTMAELRIESTDCLLLVSVKPCLPPNPDLSKPCPPPPSLSPWDRISSQGG